MRFQAEFTKSVASFCATLPAGLDVNDVWMCANIFYMGTLSVALIACRDNMPHLSLRVPISGRM